MPIGLGAQAFTLGLQIATSATQKAKPDSPGKDGDFKKTEGTTLSGGKTDVFWKWDGKDWKEINKSEYQQGIGNTNYVPRDNEPSADSLGAAVRYPADMSIGSDSDYVMFEFYEYQPPFKGVDVGIDSTGAENATAALRIASYLGGIGTGLAVNTGIDLIENALGTGKNESFSSRALAVYNQSNDDEKFYKKTSRESVILYMPEDISTGSKAQWTGKKLSSFAANAMKTAGSGDIFAGIESGAKTVTQAAGNFVPEKVNKAIRESIGKLTSESISPDELYSSTRGVILNPNVELLFGGIELRNFQLVYKLVPRNSKESEAIKKIITNFRAASLPRYADGQEINFGGGAINVAQNFIRVPNVCKVSFMRGGGLNPDVPQYKMCAMTQVDINYTPDGTYATLEDGTMVAYELTLSFQETKLVFSDEVEKY